jgi:uncharacterized protein (DUF3084 family)
MHVRRVGPIDLTEELQRLTRLETKFDAMEQTVAKIERQSEESRDLQREVLSIVKEIKTDAEGRQQQMAERIGRIESRPKPSRVIWSAAGALIGGVIGALSDLVKR